ncbi:MAG: hypothetical protein J5861_02220 [Desulfovibrio sp.]|nr:hypothetical protein [Desulfovibrio sp.]
MADSAKAPDMMEGAPKRGVLRLLLRVLFLLLLLGLVAGLGFAGWKFKDKIFSGRGGPAPATSGAALIPFCDSLSQTVYALKLSDGYGELLPVLHEKGGGLAQCGEGAENGHGKVVLRGGKAYHVLPKASGK